MSFRVFKCYVCSEVWVKRGKIITYLTAEEWFLADYKTWISKRCFSCDMYERKIEIDISTDEETDLEGGFLARYEKAQKEKERMAKIEWEKKLRQEALAREKKREELNAHDPLDWMEPTTEEDFEMVDILCHKGKYSAKRQRNDDDSDDDGWAESDGDEGEDQEEDQG